MMQSTSHENALALGANGTSGIVTRARIEIPSMGGLSTTTITTPPSNEVDQENPALLVAFPAATETVASANGAIMVVAERRDEVAEPSHKLQQYVGEDEGQLHSRKRLPVYEDLPDFLAAALPIATVFSTGDPGDSGSYGLSCNLDITAWEEIQGESFFILPLSRLSADQELNFALQEESDLAILVVKRKPSRTTTHATFVGCYGRGALASVALRSTFKSISSPLLKISCIFVNSWYWRRDPHP